MPNSKRRKRQVAANKKQVKRAKKQLDSLKDDDRKENFNPPVTKIAKGHDARNQGSSEEGTGWMGGLYNWCQSGVTQVSVFDNSRV